MVKCLRPELLLPPIPLPIIYYFHLRAVAGSLISTRSTSSGLMISTRKFQRAIGSCRSVTFWPSPSSLVSASSERGCPPKGGPRGWILLRTPHPRAYVSEMRRQFRRPVPIPFLDWLHARPDFALYGANPAALLPLPAFHILRHHVRCTRDAPLRAFLPDPEQRLHGPSTAAALHLLRIRGVARAARENVGHFLHPHVGREGRHVGFVHRWVPWGVVVGIFWQFALHAPEYTIE